MTANERIGPSDAAGLTRLSELSDFRVAKGYPDIRGWTVKTRDGHRLGKVHDLIVSTAEMRVRYVDVDTTEGSHALIPIGIAHLDGKHDDVLVHELSSTDLPAYPRYSRARGIDRTYESSVWRHFSPEKDAGGTAGPLATEFGYESDHYDDRRMLDRQDGRGATATPDTRDTRSFAPADNTAVNTGATAASSAAISSSGSPGNASRHEEVTIEMRPISDASRTGDIQISENEIRIPLMAEGPDGRRYPREEVVVRKRMVDGDSASSRTT